MRLSDWSSDVCSSDLIYTTALGTLRVTVNREIKTDFALLYDPSMWKQVNLKGRSWFRETLAKTGDNTKIMLAGEYGLKHENQIGRAQVELQSLMRISYAVFCLKKKKNYENTYNHHKHITLRLTN